MTSTNGWYELFTPYLRVVKLTTCFVVLELSAKAGYPANMNSITNPKKTERNICQLSIYKNKL
ncbi:hypothetical protein LSO9J_170022 [Candidatus Liberibacter solanacearum]